MKIEIFARRRPFRRPQWHWRTRCERNGKILARSSEGYNNRPECLQSVYRHQREMALASPIETAG